MASASASTTPFTITWTIPGTLEANTINIYQVTVNQAGRLTARTTGSSGPDTYGYIKDPDGTTLAEDDDGGGGHNFLVTAQVDDGHYHVWVKGASGGITGRYVLRVDFTAGGTPPGPPDDGDDHGNTRATATSVAAPSSTAGTLTAGDVDYFAVTVSQAGTLTVNTSGGTDTHGTLENATGGTLATDDDGGSGSNFEVSAAVGAGTYYVKVRGYSGSTTGDYQLHVAFTPSGTPPGPPDDGDDHGDTRSTATSVAAPSSTAGTLTAGDVDYFAVTVSQAGTLTANTSGATDTHGTLENAAGGTLAADDDGGSGSNFEVSAAVGAGTYYVKVRGYSGSTTGDYQLHVAFTPSGTPPGPPDDGDDHGDTRSTATSVAAPSSTAGTLTAGDVDYFAVTVSQAGTLTANTSGATDTHGTLENAAGGTLAADDDGGSGSNFEVSAAVGAGTYYVKVRGYSGSTTGDYQLHVAFTPSGTPPGPPDDGDDHGDTRATATSVAAPSSTAGTLTAGDVDYFAVTVSQAGTLTANTSGATDTHGTLENAAGGTLAADDDGGSGSNFEVSAAVGAGTYYVKVRGYSGSTTGDYRLHVAFAAEATEGELTYRGSDDQVFQLNAEGRALDDALYTVRLGAARPEVYLIATNTNSGSASARVQRLDSRVAAEGQGRGPFADVEYPSRSMHPDRSGHAPPGVVEFNNNPPPLERSLGPRRRASVQAQQTVVEGDRHEFRSIDGTVPATARRVVSDGSTTLVMWIADREWSSTCRATTHRCMTREMVNAVADKFLRAGARNDIHDLLTAIFGAPWGAHPYSNLLPPESAGQIHILFYDIGADSVGSGPRIVGYFYALHNFLRSAQSASNERLMFFMDAPLMAEPSDSTWEVTDYWPNVLISTLAHEFQHMIHFYQKRIRQGGLSETWLNEMASEVAEDLVADKIESYGPRGVAHDDPTAGSESIRRGRLPRYNYYNYIQVTTWDGEDPLKHYSISYALGAYLARTYGGAALFGDIVTNAQSGVAAIEAALRTQGHSDSFGDVLANWAAANLLSDNPRAPSRYRYNAGAWSRSRAGGETFRLGSINLYNYRYYYDEGEDDYLDGPILFQFQQFSDGIRRNPHSNAYTTLGRETGTVRLRVNADAGMRITVVVKE